MLKHTLSIIFFLIVNVLFSQTTLNHNIGRVPIATDMLSCVFAQSWLEHLTFPILELLKQKNFQ